MNTYRIEFLPNASHPMTFVDIDADLAGFDVLSNFWAFMDGVGNMVAAYNASQVLSVKIVNKPNPNALMAQQQINAQAAQSVPTHNQWQVSGQKGVMPTPVPPVSSDPWGRAMKGVGKP